MSDLHWSYDMEAAKTRGLICLSLVYEDGATRVTSGIWNERTGRWENLAGFLRGRPYAWIIGLDPPPLPKEKADA